MTPTDPSSDQTSAATAPTLGHVHLKVADLQRAIKFYTDVVGLELVTLYGDQAAFLSSHGYHHRLGLNT